MTTYYVSPSGSDSNNGLGPDASHATNKPWLTIGKALGSSGIASGDTVYIAPGTYRETVLPTMTSATAETIVAGDPANISAFKNGSGVLLDGGIVEVTAYTTDDITAPAAASTFSLNGRDFLTFRNLFVVGGTGNPSCFYSPSTSTDIKVQDCAFVSVANTSVQSVYVVGNGSAASNVTIERCRSWGFPGNTVGGGFVVELPRGASDYDSNILIQNCSVVSGAAYGIRIISSGAGAGFGGGVDMKGSTIMAVSAGVITADGNLSTSIPCTIVGCVVIGPTVLTANVSGQLVEDYNRLLGQTARTNVTAGTHSVAGTAYAPKFHFGQESQAGMPRRDLFEPMAGSPYLGFGDDGTMPSVDLHNFPRPAGGASALKAIGAYERGDTFARETGTVRTGANAISITGPGYQDFDLPVDAVSTTVMVYVRWDATYAGTKPKMQVLNGTEAGVADAAATATGSSGSWEQLSLNFTPTAKGIVTIRLLSSDTNGGGKMLADDFVVA